VLAQELESERRRLLEHVAQNADADLRATFTALAARNLRLLGLVEHQKRRVLREAAVARSARDGAAAYAELGAQSAASDVA
jgi:hypothetical protein